MRVVQVEASEPGRVYPAVGQLAGAPLCASDGEAGVTRTLLLDVAHWTVEHLVASTGGALAGRAVTIASAHLGRFDWAFAAGAVRVNLTQAEVAACPRFDTEYPGPLVRADDLTGYHVVTAGSDATGLVNDVLVDDVRWAVRFLLVDVGERTVLVPAAWIGRTDRVARAVHLVVDWAQVCAAPPFAGRASPGPNLG